MPRDMENYRRYRKEYNAARRAAKPQKLMSFDAIGKQLGISGRGAQKIYCRAIKKLKTEMERRHVGI